MALVINAPDFIELSMGKARIKNIPEGTRLVTAQYEFLRGSFLLLLEHESFRPTADGCDVRTFQAEYESVNSNPLKA